MLTAFSLLAANKSTIIKMLSKWFEIFLTLSKFHISWVDYGGQRIYHLLECLSSGKLKDIYKHCLINPYIKTCRENRREKQGNMYNFPAKKPPETQRDRGQVCMMVKSLVHPRPKPGHLVSSSTVKSSLNGKSGSLSGHIILRSKCHFLEFLPFVGATHFIRSRDINGNINTKKYWSFIEHLLQARPQFR